MDNILAVAMILSGVAMIVFHRRWVAFYLAHVFGIEDKYGMSTQMLVGGVVFIIVGVLILFQ